MLRSRSEVREERLCSQSWLWIVTRREWVLRPEAHTNSSGNETLMGNCPSTGFIVVQRGRRGNKF
jgi:hypothetical protein